MAIKEQLHNLKKLNLPKDMYVVVSSGAMAVRGIREAKDLDIIVTEKLWDNLSKEYIIEDRNGISVINLGNSIEVLGPRSMYVQPHIVPPEEVFAEADDFDGVKFMNLTHLRKIKSQSKREKDLNDVQLIDEYLKATPKTD